MRKHSLSDSMEANEQTTVEREGPATAEALQIAVTGASGMVGSRLAPSLRRAGHAVTELVRREARETEVRWEPQREFEASALDGVDAVVHLAGENIASSRWNQRVKREIRDSRVLGTQSLCRGLANMVTPPKVLVCASAIGFYGDRGQELLDEQSAPGEGFLAHVVLDWEAATQPARDRGIRVVNLRFGVILDAARRFP